MLMMPTLVAFMRAYPEIMLDLDFSDRVVDVIEEGFDAVGSSRIAGTKLLPRRPVLCAKCRPHGANLTRRAEWF
jgi:DNA-binding transcriptional LysR family regulator